MNVWWYSSDLTQVAILESGITHASAHIARSSYSSSTLRHRRLISWTPSWPQNGCGVSSSAGLLASSPPMVVSFETTSGRPSAFTRPCATSILNPAAPRSSQKRKTLSNSALTSSFSQLKSGWDLSKMCRYHCPGFPSFSVILVQATPPKTDSQLFGGSWPVSPLPSLNM